MRKSFKLLLGLLLAVLMVASVMTVGVFAEDGAVAKVDGTSYTTLGEALAAAQAGDTVTFLADITEDVTVSKSVTIDGAGKTYTGAMTLKADTTIKNVNFDGKGYNGYAVTTRGANYLTIEDCTAKNYRYGLVQLASATALTTVKNVTANNMDYGVKVDYSGAVALENVNITARVAALLNSNYGGKTIAIKDSYLNILGTWTRNGTIKTTYKFVGENTVDSFSTDAAIDSFKLAEGASLTASEEIDVTTVEGYEVVYKNGAYVSEVYKAAQIGDRFFGTLADAISAAKGKETIILVNDVTEVVTIDNKVITLDLNGKTLNGSILAPFAKLCVKNGTIINTDKNVSAIEINEGALELIDVTVKSARHAIRIDGYVDAVINGGVYSGAIGTGTGTYHALNVSGLGTVHIIDGTFTGARGTTADSGAAVNVRGDSVVYIHNGSFSNGKKSTLSGANLIEITGGTYDQDPSASLAEGYVAKLANGVYVVFKPVAQIGDTYYATLADAIKAAKAGDVVDLLGNSFTDAAGFTLNGFTLANGSITFKKGARIGVHGDIVLDNVDLTFDMDGTSGYPNTAIYVNGGSIESITLKNGSDVLIKNPGFTAIYNDGNKPYALNIDNSTLTIEGKGTATGINSAAITLANGAALTTSNTGIAINGGSLTVDGTSAVTVSDANSHGITNVVLTVAAGGKVDVDNCIYLGLNIQSGSVIADGAIVTVDNCGTSGSYVGIPARVNGTTGYENLAINGKTIVAKHANGNSFTSIADAIAAAKEGNTVTILAGDYTTSVSVNKAITVVGETDENGNNLVNITGKLNITADGATVKNLNVNNGSSSAGYINAKDVLVEGCTVVGGNGFRSCYTTGTVTFLNSTITGSSYGIHFDGYPGGNIVIDNCVITGWTSFAATIEKVTISNTIFAEGNYNYLRFYQNEVVIEGCTFNEDMTIDIAVNGATVTVTDSAMSDGSDVLNAFNKADLCGQNDVTINGDKIAYVAKIGNAYYETLEEALAAVTDYTLIKLVADATLDYNARDAYGRQTTTDIIIDGQNFTLTLNQKNSDWASIGMANSEGKLTLKNMTIEKTGYGDTSGAWNTHAIIFSCNVEMNNVTVNNGIAVQNGATLNNVTINEANGYYGLWINGNGQTVTVTGGAINATNGGRGIKIADQYINDPASVTLNVTGMTFNTAKKAAVLVSSKAGAAITATDVDITKVVADSVNFAWVDEDWAANFGKVTVNGAPAAQEGISSFDAAVVRDDQIAGYYKTLADAIAAAQAGDTVRVFEGTYKMPSMKAGITIEGEGNVLFNGTLTGTLENLTLKNLHIKGGNAQRWAYAKGDLVFENVTFEATSVYALHFDGITDGATLLYKDCTIIGWVAMSGSPESCVFDGCTIKDNGYYGVIRTYFDATIKNCTFDVDGANTTDVYEDGIHSVAATITVNNCTNVNGDMKDLLNITNGANVAGYIILDGEVIHYHSWTAVETVAPGYGTEGYTSYKCPCGETKKDDIVPALFTAAIGSVKYATLQDAIDAAKPGATITLLADASGAGVVINKNININFNGFTYTLTTPVGSTGTASNGFQILKGNTVNLRNGTLKVADEAADKFYILIQNYANLTVKQMTLDGTNLDKWSKTDGDSYVVSNNSGTVSLDVDIITNDEGHLAWAFDVCDKTAWGYQLPVVTTTTRTTINGNKVATAAAAEKIEAAVKCGNTYYATLQHAVDMAKDTSGAFVLMRDLSGSGVVINKNFILDFGGHTYTLTTPVGSTGTASNGFQILKGNTVTLRNGTLKVADEAAGKFYILIQNYANLTVNNMTLDGTNLDKWSLTDGDSYTLSNNSGNVTIGVGTKIIANNDGALAFAFDACDKTAWGYELPVVTVHKDAVIEGNIEAAAKIGNKYYATLQQAIDAAADKQTVTLLNDITVGKNDANILDGSYYTFFKVEGKSVTVDLNGHNIFADAAGMDKLLVGVFSTENGGHLTLNDTVGGAVVEAVANGATVYSLIANYEPGCSITINGGTYKLDKASDSLIYSGASVGENEGIVVNGGTFVLDNVDTGVNGKPWIFNVLGSNNRHVDVHGGTFNFNIAYQNWAHEVNIVDDKGNLSYVIDNGDGTWTVSGKTAEVGIVSNTYSTKGFLVGYATFKDAVASIKKGQAETTIKLQKNITVKGQFIGHSYAQKVVIDLNGYTMSSADKTLTVYRSGTTVLIKNGTVSGNTSGGTIQVTYGGQLTLENVTVKSAGGSGNAIKVDANSTLIIADENVKVLGGARVNDILAANGAIIKISAGFFAHPVKDEWCAEGYFPITVEGGYSVATGACMIGNTVYGSLADAIEAAKDGDIIVMKNDITVSYADALDAADGFKSLFVISGKTITIDLNGKKILGDATGAPELVGGKYPEGMLLGMFTTLANGHLTLVDSSEGEGTVELASNGCLVYGLIVNYDKDCSITINEGNYIADDVFDALVYTSCDEGVVVNDGYFYLANVGQGTRGNGSPWIFNALGQNINSVVVNGGTFNANVNAQHWVFEVKVDKTLALKDNGDGTWTVVEAVAYVNNQHWASGWYTRETGYATFQEALAACEGVKTMTIGKKDYTSEKEIVTLLGDIDLDGPIIIG